MLVKMVKFGKSEKVLQIRVRVIYAGCLPRREAIVIMVSLI
jgi:hypothetical protein